MKFSLNKSVVVLMLAVVPGLLQAASVTIEAESGSRGADWAISNSSSPVFITVTGTGANIGAWRYRRK